MQMRLTVNMNDVFIKCRKYYTQSIDSFPVHINNPNIERFKHNNS